MRRAGMFGWMRRVWRIERIIRIGGVGRIRRMRRIGMILRIWSITYTNMQMSSGFVITLGSLGNVPGRLVGCLAR